MSLNYVEEDAVYDSRRPEPPEAHQRPTTERPHIKWTLIGIAVVFMLLVLVIPLALVFQQAFGKGIEEYFSAFSDPGSQAAIRLTLIVAAIAVPLNLVFGI